MGDGPLNLDPALGRQAVGLAPGASLPSVDIQGGAGVVVGGPQAVACIFRPLGPRLHRDVKIPAVPVIAVHGVVAMIFSIRVDDLFSPVLYIEGQVHSLIRYIPVMDSLLIAVVVAIEVLVVVYNLVV